MYSFLLLVKTKNLHEIKIQNEVKFESVKTETSFRDSILLFSYKKSKNNIDYNIIL